MERDGEQVKVTPTEARAGGDKPYVRYILIISLVLAIIVLSATWMTGAISVSQDDDGPAPTAQ